MNVPELISAYSEYNQLSQMLLGTLITLISAYLVATFLAVDRLSWFQLSVISVMYLYFSVDLAGGYYFHSEMAISIHDELMLRIKAEDSAVQFLFDPGTSRSSAIAPLVVAVASVLFSIVFAIHNKRKRNVDATDI
ncbi:MAG: hypothetical protein ACI9ON_002485 [Limisphaerales bacterium]|jgi:hypothetical protein